MYRRIFIFSDWDHKHCEFFVNCEVNKEFLNKVKGVINKYSDRYGEDISLMFDTEHIFDSKKEIIDMLKLRKELMFFDDNYNEGGYLHIIDYSMKAPDVDYERINKIENFWDLVDDGEYCELVDEIGRLFIRASDID